ncbi:META domain-containing protein [Pokkaliibacter sp. CJK22405]|uniref:META domain-containing protein n=1 Tax=Pokkaliibacter sp. CJK22405 TaxID=3384615 RepID=UPI00398494FD
MTRLLLVLPAVALIAGCSLTPANERGQTEPLQGTDWQLYQVLDQPVTVETTRPLSIQFATQGNQVSGYSGCNRFSGTYSLYGGRMSFEPLISTKMACRDMNTEQRYMDALSSVRSWEAKGTELWLMNADQQPLLRFKAAPEM